MSMAFLMAAPVTIKVVFPLANYKELFAMKEIS